MAVAIPIRRDSRPDDDAVAGATARTHDRAWLIAAGSVLAFAGTGVLAAQPGWLSRLDQRASTLIASRRSVAAVRAARAVSAAAEPALVAAPIAVSALAAGRRGGWLAGCVPCVTVLTGAAVRRRICTTVARQRPPADIWLAEPEGFSLPSKHTCLAALTAGACARAVGARSGTSQAAALTAATAVGASRVCLGVHWPADVAAGWLFAAGWLGLADLLQPRQVRGGRV